MKIVIASGKRKTAIARAVIKQVRVEYGLTVYH